MKPLRQARVYLLLLFGARGGADEPGFPVQACKPRGYTVGEPRRVLVRSRGEAASAPWPEGIAASGA